MFPTETDTQAGGRNHQAGTGQGVNTNAIEAKQTLVRFPKLGTPTHLLLEVGTWGT